MDPTRRRQLVRSIPSTVLVVAALVLSGCLAPGTSLQSSSTDVAGTSLPQAVDGLAAYTPLGGLEPLPAGAGNLSVRVAATGYGDGEPTLGVTSDGTIYATAAPAGVGDQYLVASNDGGRTWVKVGSPLLDPQANLDPWMWVDPVTDRIYNGPLYVACSWLSWSDDGGGTWQTNPVAGCGIPAHDHQKITTGPPAPGVTTIGYPDVVYYAYNGAFRDTSPGPSPLAGTWVSTSLDGGRTFTSAVQVFPNDPCHGGINGPVGVGPNGTAYVAHATCNGTAVAVSHDSGQTWTATVLTGRGMYQGLSIDPEISTDTAGNAYLTTPGKDGRLYLSVSTDRGATWSDLVPVTPPGVNFTAFETVIAGDPGHVALAYLGTTADVSTWQKPEPSYASNATVWQLYLTTSGNALDANPTFVTKQVTPDGDPVQRGCIWMWGGSSTCRNLYDFIAIAQHDGRPYVAFTDGCNACQDAAHSHRLDLHIAIQSTGPGLRTGQLLQPLVKKVTAS